MGQSSKAGVSSACSLTQSNNTSLSSCNSCLAEAFILSLWRAALHSNILAAAVELDGTDAPFIGGAAIQILDIAPSQNAVQVRVNVLFNSPVRFRLALVIWP